MFETRKRHVKRSVLRVLGLICLQQHQDQIIQEVKRLSDDPTVHGILVQLPLPKHVNHRAVLEAITPLKDVDGLTGMSHGSLFIHGLEAGLVPCTPLGVMRLLQDSNISPEGKHAVVLGRSNLVGKPVALLLLSRNATVTICHSKTKDLPAILGQADILIAAVGIANFVKGEWLKPGAVVIDVGINAFNDPAAKRGYRLVGDTDYESCKKVASAITPVPGGVGPMTVAMLMSNTVKAWELQHGQNPTPEKKKQLLLFILTILLPSSPQSQYVNNLCFVAV